jgi:hypothetical protein
VDPAPPIDAEQVAAHHLLQPVDDVGVVRVEAVAAEIEGKAVPAERASEAAHRGAALDDDHGPAGARNLTGDGQAGHAPAEYDEV